MTTQDYIDGVASGEYEDPTTLYAIRVGEGRIVAGPPVRAACRRHLKDLGREDVVWDVDAALDAIGFFKDVLVFTDGDKVDAPFVLEPWQCFIVGSLFGWKGEDGWRRFRTAYIEIGKGSGKSPLAGGIGLKLLAADGEGAAEVYAAATKLDQAKILWNDAKRMAEKSPHLSRIVEVRTNLLAVVETNSIFKPVSAEKRGLDGPRVHGGLIDEIHEHPDATVVDKIRAGTKGRKQALIVEITNSGFNKQSICYQHHEYTLRILTGIELNDSWFGFICALDPGDDWEKDERCWIKANPNLGVSIQMKYLREQVNEARAMPAKKALVARLNFCVWTGAESPWVDEEKWGACLRSGAEIDELVDGAECYLGADLSQRKDLTALSATWKVPGGFASKVWYFTPKEGIGERSKQDRAPYDLWAEQGWITATPGSIVDYKFVVKKIMELCERYDVQGLAYDPWKIEALKADAESMDFYVEMVKHGQGFTGAGAKDALWMPRSLEVFEEAVLTGTYYVENNPVTLMCAANAQVKQDPAGNRKFEKVKASGKMDGTVAQAMSIGFASEGFPQEVEDTTSKYESAGFIVL